MKLIHEKKYYECIAQDFMCPYWDERYQMCGMEAKGEGNPTDECDSCEQKEN